MSFLPSTILRDIHVALKYILNTLNRPLWVDPTTSRVKTDTVVTSVPWVTIGAFGSGAAYNQDRAAWTTNVRTRIT